MSEGIDQPFVFPKWANYALPGIIVGVIGLSFYAPTVVALGGSPKTTAVGYCPIQPVPYSHALHAGQLGIDCRYCHTTVEKAAFAALPPTQTCMNCHSMIRTKSAKLLPVRESWATGRPIQWVKVHDLPEYVYFNHSAHVNHGVGCIECHGRIDRMERVYQVKPLSMGWCLDCHRDPGPHLRPKDVAVTDMNWKPPSDPGDAANMADELVSDSPDGYGIHSVQYMTSCSTCHR
ncbi:MAG TPA: cytochrome c3 family protein [Tepidisphaeraceae bacterium]|nr:cytochrome c3 family protein [Tepidisphaeraceae bacterium]